jgi:hypothetical protein
MTGAVPGRVAAIRRGAPLRLLVVALLTALALLCGAHAAESSCGASAAPGGHGHVSAAEESLPVGVLGLCALVVVVVAVGVRTRGPAASVALGVRPPVYRRRFHGPPRALGLAELCVLRV